MNTRAEPQKTIFLLTDWQKHKRDKKKKEMAEQCFQECKSTLGKEKGILTFCPDNGEKWSRKYDGIKTMQEFYIFAIRKTTLSFRSFFICSKEMVTLNSRGYYIDARGMVPFARWYDFNIFFPCCNLEDVGSNKEKDLSFFVGALKQVFPDLFGDGQEEGTE